MLKTMLENSLSALHERAKEVFLNALLKPITDTKTKKRYKLRCWVWVVIVAVAIIGGRFLFFKVESKPFQLPLIARDWTGFGESYNTNVSEVAEKGTETVGETTKRIDKVTTTQRKLEPAKTLWDWMGLLLAPATLAALGFLFQSSQEQAKRDKEEADKKRDADQQREEALQAYFDQLSALLVDKRLLRKLPNKEEESTNSEAQPFSNNPISKPESKIDVKDPDIDAEAALDVVKAKTLSLFRLFDNADPIDMPRKALVLAFLGDTWLLKVKALHLDLSRTNWREANLKNADLSYANLAFADLRNANLENANLTSAFLLSANLENADLFHAILAFADLRNANLENANLQFANLTNANLQFANLTSANLTSANLENANLTSANLENANLTSANLTSAFLLSANLSSANLSSAKFINAYLLCANLSNAILLEVNLTQTQNLTQQQLEGEDPPLLCNAKLPDEINVSPNRDRKKLPQVLLERYPNNFKTLKDAQEFMDTEALMQFFR